MNSVLNCELVFKGIFLWIQFCFMMSGSGK